MYHISWEDDSETGEKYLPTWEPKENVNEAAVNDWLERKAAKKCMLSSARIFMTQLTIATAKKGRARRVSTKQRETSSVAARGPTGRPSRRRVIESSPTPPTVEALDTTDTVPEIGETQQSPSGDSTLSELESADGDIQAPQLQGIREATVQVTDPPSSYNQGVYQRIDLPSSDNGTGSETVDLSASLPGKYSASAPVPFTQQLGKVVPDSQSQSRFPEDSTFRGFSSSQPQADIQSEETEQPSQDNRREDFGEKRSLESPRPALQLVQVTYTTGSQHDEGQASGGAQQIQTPEEDIDRAVLLADPVDSSAYNPILPEQIDGTISSALASFRASAHSTPESTAQPTLEDDLASSGAAEEQQLNTGDFLVKLPQRLATPEINSQEPSQRSSDRPAQAALELTREEPLAFAEAVQEQQSNAGALSPKQRSPTPQRSVTPKTHFQETPRRSSEQSAQATQEPLSTARALLQTNDYIVVSEEEDPDSSLGLLTQADYNPPAAGQRPLPSSPLTEIIASTKIPDICAVASSDLTQSSSFFATQIAPLTKLESRPRVVYSQHLTLTSSRSSSQIPLVPSQSLVTIGESAPISLRTPSPTSTADPANMESAGNPLLARLNAISESGKARRKARRSNTPSLDPASVPAALTHGIDPSAMPANLNTDQRDGARSPSTVPALVPEPVVTREEMRTSGRLPSLVPIVNGSGSEEQDALTVSEATKSTQDDPELAGVHALPVPFGNIQRDQYKNGFHWYKGDIQGFLDGDNSSEQASKAELAVDELRKIAMHPDLINSETFSQPLSTSEQSQWDVDASCKFRFLRDLMEQLQLQFQDRDIHIVVAAKGNIIPEMFSRFLQGINVPHTRLSTLPQTLPRSHAGHTGLRVSVLDVDGEVGAESMSRADLVVGMDGASSYQEHLIQAARHCERTSDDWAPLLTLVAPCTVEHIERSLLPSIVGTTRLRTLLNTALKLQLQELAGRLAPGQSSSKEAAFKITSFLASPSSLWPVEELGLIDNLDSQTETDIDPSFSGSKRPLDVDMDTLNGDAGKRPRVLDATSQLPTTINPQDMDLTHISDSLGTATQSEQSAELDQLRQILDGKHDELQEHVSAMSQLQFRHEDQHVELAKTKKERDEALVSAQTAEARMTISLKQCADLRTERTELKEKLEEANSKLRSHEIPERREFEVLRLALEQEKLAREKAEKRIEQELKAIEYTRDMYQNTSSRARQLAQENAELEARLVEAEKLASGEQARAHQASSNGHNKLLAKENKRLKATLVDRDAGLKFRDEEIARLKERGRMGTRASSVPRSPRMGSPALKGRASRQASPAAAEPKAKHLHPLRNG